MLKLNPKYKCTSATTPGTCCWDWNRHKYCQGKHPVAFKTIRMLFMCFVKKPGEEHIPDGISGICSSPGFLTKHINSIRIVLNATGCLPWQYLWRFQSQQQVPGVVALVHLYLGLSLSMHYLRYLQGW